MSVSTTHCTSDRSNISNTLDMSVLMWVNKLDWLLVKKYKAAPCRFILCHILIFDFKLSPRSECCTLSLVWIPGAWVLYDDVSEQYVCSIFIGGTYATFEEGPECSETSEHKIQAPGIHTRERIKQNLILDNGQLDTQLLYFTIRLLWSLHVSSIICSSSGGWIVWCSIWYRRSQ